MSNRVLITGANGLIGRALVELFASQNWDVIAHSRQPFTSAGKNVIADLHSPGSGTELVQSVGPIDCVINNAANQEVIDIHSVQPSDIAKIFRINVAAPAEIMIAAKSAGAKVAINISSIEAITPRPGHEIYGASKAALESLTRSLANSLSPMRVHGIRLGLVGDSNLEERWPEGVSSWNSLVPAHRYASPKEVAELALMMSSPNFAFATGAILDFDGGKSASPGW
ncbi:MAG: SDR family oxidoreductase [Actinobacteria bacterium]|nr:SDR family oxidoreductase [Actinomycetota bacterium]